MQGLLTGEGGAITSSQEPEALIQPRRKECYLHSPYSSRGQFERQGNAIEPTADLDHGSCIAISQPKRRFGSVCPFHKETESVVVKQSRPIHRLGFIGEAQSRDAQDHFPVDRERLTTGCKQRQAWTARQKRGHDAGTFLNDMFTVVQHQEQVPGQEICPKPLDR